MLHHTTEGAIGRPVKQARGQTRAVYHEDASHHAIRMHDPLRDESLSVELSPGRSGAGVTRLGSYTDVASQQVGLFLSLSLSLVLSFSLFHDFNLSDSLLFHNLDLVTSSHAVNDLVQLFGGVRLATESHLSLLPPPLALFFHDSLFGREKFSTTHHRLFCRIASTQGAVAIPFTGIHTPPRTRVMTPGTAQHRRSNFNRNFEVSLHSHANDGRVPTLAGVTGSSLLMQRPSSSFFYLVLFVFFASCCTY